MMRLRFRSRSWFMGALGVALLASPEARAEAAEPPVPAALREAAVPAEAWAARPARHPGPGAGAPAPEAALELRRSAPLPAEHPAESDPFEVERQVDRVVVVKSERQLYLFDGPLLLRSYPVALGFSPEGAKQVQGDGKTPEGAYVLDSRKADSDFHRAIHVSYPNERDRERAAAFGRSPGGAIMIHGLPEGREDIGQDHTTADWTNGCIAVTNEQIEELWSLIDDGTPIHILP